MQWQKVPPYVLDVLKMAMKLDEHSLASTTRATEGDPNNVVVTMAEVTKKAYEETGNVKTKFAKITKAYMKNMKFYRKKFGKLCEERAREVDCWKTIELESQMVFGRICEEAFNQIWPRPP